MKKVSISLLLFSAMLLTSCGEGGNANKDEHGTEASAETTVVEDISTKNHGQSGVIDEVSDMNALQLALSDERFATLCTAVTETHIEDVLVNAGPLTVFAPMNSGFDKLPEGTLDKLLEPEDKSELAGILKNHVAPSNYPIKQLKKEAKKGRKLYMASGNYVEVTVDEDKVLVGGFPILESHKVSNGWVHVIDDVILPE